MNLKTPVELKKDVHFGGGKQVIFSDKFDMIYSVGAEDGTVFKTSTSGFSSSSIDNIASISRIHANSIELHPNLDDLLVIGNNELRRIKNDSEDTSSVMYKDDNDLIGLCCDYKKGSIIVSSSSNVTLLTSSGKKIKTLYSDNNPITWIGVGNNGQSVGIFTSSPSLVLVSTSSFSVELYRDLPNGASHPLFDHNSNLLFSIPDKAGCINIYNIETKKEAFIKISKHQQPITKMCLTTSSYLATTDRTGMINISQLEFNNIQMTEKALIHQPISCLLSFSSSGRLLTHITWGGRSIAACDEDGVVHYWENIILSDEGENKKESGIKGIKTIAPKKKMDIADALKSLPPSSKPKQTEEEFSISDVSDDDVPKIIPEKKRIIIKEKIKKPRRTVKETDEEDIDEEDEEDRGMINDDVPDFEEPAEPDSETSSGHEISDNEKEDVIIPEEAFVESEHDFSDEIDTSFLDDITLPFMPGSCSTFIGNRRYLCWNLYGAVLLRTDDTGIAHIDIHPSKDSTFSEDHFPNNSDFSMATIDQYGFLAASTNTILYKHHTTWSRDNITHLDLASDSIKMIATGNEWFAFACESRNLHIFSSSGVEIALFSLSGNIISMVGYEQKLFVVYGTKLEYSLFNIKKRVLISNGVLSVMPPLLWVGISTTGMPLIQDSANVVHALINDFGWMWVPIADLETMFDDSTTDYWLVGADEKYLYGVPLYKTKSPATSRIPQCHSVEIQPLSIDTTIRPYIFKYLDYSINNKQRTILSDSELLKLFIKALKEGQEIKAYNIAQYMRTGKFRNASIEFADKNGYKQLSDSLLGIQNSSKNIPKFVSKNENKENVTNHILQTDSSQEIIYVRRETPEKRIESYTPRSSFADALASLSTSKTETKSQKKAKQNDYMKEVSMKSAKASKKKNLNGNTLVDQYFKTKK